MHQRTHLVRAVASLAASLYQLGVTRGYPGSVTSIQRFSSTLSTNVHFRSLFPDGVLAEQPDGTVRFVEIDPPADAEVEAITRKIAIRVLRLFQSLDETGDGVASSDPLRYGFSQMLWLLSESN